MLVLVRKDKIRLFKSGRPFLEIARLKDKCWRGIQLTKEKINKGSIMVTLYGNIECFRSDFR